MPFPPERPVCRTEETVETLYRLGESHRIVGVTGYAVCPPRNKKPGRITHRVTNRPPTRGGDKTCIQQKYNN
jgi:iron complex transport system substrate-binding protein